MYLWTSVVEITAVAPACPVSSPHLTKYSEKEALIHFAVPLLGAFSLVISKWELGLGFS